MHAEILGIGWVTAGGLGRGRQAASFQQPTGELPVIARQDVFVEPDLRFGRLDPFSKAGLTAIALALQDAGLDRWTEKRPFALIAGTRYGCLGTDSDYFTTVLPQGGGLPSPQLFVYTLPNCFLGEAAIRFGLTGPAWVASDPAADPLAAVRLGLETIAWEEAETVLAGVCELPRPAILDPAGEQRPVVLFLVLSRSGSGMGEALGEIGLEGGKLLVGGEEVADMEELIKRLRKE